MRLTVDDAFHKYGDRMFASAFCVCQNNADADDAVQYALIKYYSLDKDYEDENHLKAWLLRVAINRAKDIASSYWRRRTVSWEDYMNDLTFEEPKDSRLFEAVMRLPGKYRVVVHLHYYEDYSVEETAKLLRRSAGTVKSRLSRARKQLKNMLREEWNSDE